MNTLSHIILYVDSIEKALSFYKQAFGIPCRFLHDSGTYAELDTGSTALAFISRETAKSHLGVNIPRPKHTSEIVFTNPDVASALNQALSNGAKLVQPVQEKPWGQSIAYVEDIDGHLIELSSPLPH